MMKAAQAPGVGGGLPLGAPNQSGHSPQHQNMHAGRFYFGKNHNFKIMKFMHFPN